ncbi:MAG TPA: heme o synthase [Candidatus Marinimicrobia bacterium]|nr:heme o synthase [Candidatus Neomarinimicrobiota bacterium]|tara:strand:+ start:136 stop:987 length:852 start_codon:yes stop_codon:yes gene_type:complete
MIKNLIELTKIRIGFLVLTTTVIGFYLGSEGNFSSSLLLYTIMGTLCSSTGGSIINNVIEVESDKKMDRTKGRVLPTKKISVQFALFLGLLFIVLGISTLYLKVNTLTAILSALTIILYLLVYTPLKRVSWINTSVGAIPGAIPPLGGWTAATNSLDWGGVALFLILFFWQHPHFYAIAFIYKDDYDKAGLKMLSGLNNGVKKTALHIFLHALVLIPISTLPFFFEVSGRIYFVGAYLLSNVYMLCCLPFILEQSRENARLIFKTSIYYFPLLFFLILADLFI